MAPCMVWDGQTEEIYILWYYPYRIFTYVWLIFVVSAGKFIIHGASWCHTLRQDAWEWAVKFGHLEGVPPTGSLGDLVAAWLLTTYPNWDGPPSCQPFGMSGRTWFWDSDDFWAFCGWWFTCDLIYDSLMGVQLQLGKWLGFFWLLNSYLFNETQAPSSCK